MIISIFALYLTNNGIRLFGKQRSALWRECWRWILVLQGYFAVRNNVCSSFVRWERGVHQTIAGTSNEIRVITANCGACKRIYYRSFRMRFGKVLPHFHFQWTIGSDNLILIVRSILISRAALEKCIILFYFFIYKL